MQLITLIGNLWRTMLTREFSFFSRKENTIRDGGSTALYAAYTVYTVDTVDNVDNVDNVCTVDTDCTVM